MGRITIAARAVLAALVLLAPLPLAAQGSVNDFDLRPRAAPTPAPPPVVGPSDPDNPAPRARPQAEPRAEAAPIVLPTATSAPATTTSAAPPSARPQARAQPGTQVRAAAPLPQTAAGPDPASPPSEPGATGPAPTPAASPSAPYQPRQLDVVSNSSSSLIWTLVGGLAVLLGTGGWLAWSRHFRHRARALPAPDIVRPHVAAALPETPHATPAPESSAPAALAPALALVLQATRMSATLVNTTLSYRLSVTNNGAEPLRDVIVAGDMIAAHASRPVEQLLGPRGAALPELHRIAGLAPGESVTLGGDIRLPLVSITPIRSGSAALFVPLARLRARGSGVDGATIEGGGTFLVGQPGAAAAGTKGPRLQPFRLDLGPRNYSRLGQQLLPAA